MDWPRWVPWPPMRMMASPSCLKASVAIFVTSGIRPTPPMAGVGRMPWPMGLVVERDVARHDGKVQRAAGLADALDGLDEGAHDLGLLGVAEVEVVGDGDRVGAHGGQVAPDFGDGLLAALERVGLDIARRARRCTRRWPCPSSDTRTTAASPPGICAVLDWIRLSYCSHTQRRDDMSGEPISFITAATRSLGAGTSSALRWPASSARPTGGRTPAPRRPGP